MSVKRIVAIVFIYLLACGGWLLLGTTTAVRSGLADDLLGERVQRQWGGPIVQVAPKVTTAAGSGRAEILPERTRVGADLALEHRRKGLIWYPTYACRFAGTWTLANEGAEPLLVEFLLPLPDPQGTYEGFAVSVGGVASRRLHDPAVGIAETVTVPPRGRVDVAVSYATRGLESWRYRAGGGIGRVRDLELVLRTDAYGIDYPEGCISPTSDTRTDKDGREMRWATGELITHLDIGVALPARLNPGPLAARITFFAPVCLGFFFLLVAAITVVRRIAIHPMHYLFVAGGFFAFHLLLAYLVDHIDIHLAFPLAAATTVVLVTTYLRGALGVVFPTLAAVAGQLFFLVLFSYSFFLKGMTGLTVAVGSVVTLAVLMRLTARVDWAAVFASPTPSECPARRGDPMPG